MKPARLEATKEIVTFSGFIVVGTSFMLDIFSLLSGCRAQWPVTGSHPVAGLRFFRLGSLLWRPYNGRSLSLLKRVAQAAWVTHLGACARSASVAQE